MQTSFPKLAESATKTRQELLSVKSRNGKTNVRDTVGMHDVYMLVY